MTAWSRARGTRVAEAFHRTSRPTAIRYDIYLDASGRDNWCEPGQAWYVLAAVAVRDSHRWKQFVAWAATRPGGSLHASDRHRPGEMSNHDLARHVIDMDVPELVLVTVIHRDSMARALRAELPPDAHPHAACERVWSMTIRGLVKQLRDEGMTGLSIPIRRVIINHPGRNKPGLKAIYDQCADCLGSTHMESRPGTDPGIGLADRIAWSVYRFLDRGERRQFPDERGRERSFRWGFLLMHGRGIEYVKTLDDLHEKAAVLLRTAAGKTSDS
jgi:hypothetical protein